MLCEIDPSGVIKINKGLISLPGSISAMALHRPIDVEEEFSAVTNLYKSSPIVYYYGSTDITEKKHIYSSMLSELALSVKKKMSDKLLKHSGYVIDTPSQFVEEKGYGLLYEAIQEFDGIIG
jgi:polyribonucleotide 5'-hydroxyl-kinase